MLHYKYYITNITLQFTVNIENLIDACNFFVNIEPILTILKYHFPGDCEFPSWVKRAIYLQNGIQSLVEPEA